MYIGKLTAASRASAVVTVEDIVGVVCGGQLLAQYCGAVHSAITPVQDCAFVVISPAAIVVDAVMTSIRRHDSESVTQAGALRGY